MNVCPTYEYTCFIVFIPVQIFFACKSLRNDFLAILYFEFENGGKSCAPLRRCRVPPPEEEAQLTTLTAAKLPFSSCFVLLSTSYFLKNGQKQEQGSTPQLRARIRSHEVRPVQDVPQEGRVQVLEEEDAQKGRR